MHHGQRKTAEGAAAGRAPLPWAGAGGLRALGVCDRSCARKSGRRAKALLHQVQTSHAALSLPGGGGVQGSSGGGPRSSAVSIPGDDGIVEDDADADD